MKRVEDGHYVKVHYTGKYETGEVFDSSTGCRPLEVHMGAQEVIPGFESALKGMIVNEKKTFTVDPSNAYGDWDGELEQTVQVSDFPEDFEPQVGQVLILEDEEKGQFPAMIKSMVGEDVVLDLNHPLAGKTLTFDIEVLEINDKPTETECGCGCSCS